MAGWGFSSFDEWHCWASLMAKAGGMVGGYVDSAHGQMDGENIGSGCDGGCT